MMDRKDYFQENSELFKLLPEFNTNRFQGYFIQLFKRHYFPERDLNENLAIINPETGVDYILVDLLLKEVYEPLYRDIHRRQGKENPKLNIYNSDKTVDFEILHREIEARSKDFLKHLDTKIKLHRLLKKPQETEPQNQPNNSPSLLSPLSPKVETYQLQVGELTGCLQEFEYSNHGPETSEEKKQKVNLFLKQLGIMAGEEDKSAATFQLNFGGGPVAHNLGREAFVYTDIQLRENPGFSGFELILSEKMNGFLTSLVKYKEAKRLEQEIYDLFEHFNSFSQIITEKTEQKEFVELVQAGENAEDANQLTLEILSDADKLARYLYILPLNFHRFRKKEAFLANEPVSLKKMNLSLNYANFIEEMKKFINKMEKEGSGWLWFQRVNLPKKIKNLKKYGEELSEITQLIIAYCDIEQGKYVEYLTDEQVAKNRQNMTNFLDSYRGLEILTKLINDHKQKQNFGRRLQEIVEMKTELNSQELIEALHKLFLGNKQI